MQTTVGAERSPLGASVTKHGTLEGLIPSSAGRIALLLILAGSAIGGALYRILQAPFWSFNGTLLITAFEAGHGVTQYPLLHHGPLHSSLYGPITAFFYLPSLLGHTPNSVVLVAVVWTAVVSIATISLLLHTESRSDWMLFTLGIVTAVLLMLTSEPLRFAVFTVHADAPGLAFGMLSLTAIQRSRRGSLMWLGVAAVLSALAIWSKQPFVGLPLGIAFYLWLAQGRKAAISFAAFAIVASLALMGVFGLWYGRGMFEGMFFMPGSHPWIPGSKVVVLLNKLRLIINTDLILLVPLLGYSIYIFASYAGRRTELRAYAADHLWVAALLSGIFLTPFSMIGMAKLGGFFNSMCFATMFLMVSLVLLLMDLARERDTPLAKTAGYGLIATAVLTAMFNAPLSLAARGISKQLPLSDQQQAFVYIRNHPGVAYFPNLPLAHFLGEGRDFNNIWGIWDHRAGRLMPTQADIRGYMPAYAEFLATGEDAGYDIYQARLTYYLPEYVCAGKDPELKGLKLLYTKSAAATRGLPCVVPAPDPAPSSSTDSNE